MSELRLALRRLRQRPAAALASIVALACAIAGAAATWTLLSAVLLNPVPVPEPERVVAVADRISSGQPEQTLNEHYLYPDFLRMRESGIFSDVAAGGLRTLLVVSPDGGGAQLPVLFASHDYFDVLRLQPALGRSFTPEEDRRGAPIVAVLSYRHWMTAFGSDPGVLGRQILVAGTAATVIGIAPRGFRGTSLAVAPDVYLPLHAIASVDPGFTNYFAEPVHKSSPTAWLQPIGRLRPGDTLAAATARLDTLFFAPASGARSGERHESRADRASRWFAPLPLNAAAIPAPVRNGMRQFTRLLAATVGLLLLVGCGTVGMLLLVRTEARREEFGMCLALGATRGRLARGIVLEGALLAGAGVLLALPLAHWLLQGLALFQLPGRVSIELLDLTVDVRAIAVAAACGAIATLLIAIVAGVFGFTAGVSDAMRSRAGATSRATRRRTRTVLIAGQVAATLVLVAGAGLFARSLSQALALNAATTPAASSRAG